MSKIYIYLVVCFLMVACHENKKLTIEYTGENMVDVVSITRDKSTKTAILHVDVPGEWAIYGGPQVETINLQNPLLKGSESGSYSLNVSKDTRSYFLFVSGDKQAILAEKHLPLEGSYNFRDLGGFRTTDGKYTRWGKAFRSDDMSHLTDYDMTYLASIPLRSVVDFRSVSEVNESPDKLPASVNGHYVLNISPGNLTGEDGLNLAHITEQVADSIMKAINIQLASDPESIRQYKKFFELLQEPETTPLAFHCTAGKDRTGFASYLILSALGVDEETILNDYLLSNRYLEEKYKPYMDQYPVLKPLFEVRRGYIDSAVNHIKNEYGDVQTYLTKILNVDLKKMKEYYLYP